MSKREIYKALRNGGLSRAGALAMMGNIGAESGFKSDIVEKRCSMSDWDYTHSVNIGAISKEQFATDSYGYGLCQWTLAYRKRKLWDFAYMANESIGDEHMQVQFILRELTTEGEYASLYKFLCETSDMYEATSRVCTIYERPAVNNIDARYAIACQCANEAYDDDEPADEDSSGSTDSCEISVRVLRRGDKGRDVFLLQSGLCDMGIDCGIPDGDFGPKTETAVNELKQNIGLDANGVADADVWQIIFQ